MPDDILNRIDSSIAEYVDWDGHSEDSVRQLEDGTVIDNRPLNVALAHHINDIAVAQARAARIAATALSDFYRHWITTMQPVMDALAAVAEAITTTKPTYPGQRQRPPRTINPTRARVPHQTNRHRGGHRG